MKLSDILPPNGVGKGLKKLNAKKFVGKVKLNVDPLEIQKKIRNESE